MGYFSNGTEGDMYEEQYCSRCIHFPDYEDPNAVGCPIIGIHMLYNSDQCKRDDQGVQTSEAKTVGDMLNMLIPRNKKECHNEQCTMFKAK